MKNLLMLVIAMTSFHASADRYEIGKATKSFQVTQATTELDLKLSIPFYKIEERVVVERVTCRIPTCSTEVGDGSSSTWHNFFTVKKAEKARALAAAVKGIGASIADKIVDLNLLTNKPNSWKEFSGMIKRIEKQLNAQGLNLKFATQVLEQYGYDNIIGLGYGNEQSCRTVDTMCDQVTVKEFKTLSHYIARNLSVIVRNQSLQSFETDTVEVTAGTEANDVAVSVSGHNSYRKTLYSGGSVLELEGTRILRAFPSREVALSLTKDLKNSLVMSLTAPSYHFNAEDAGSQIFAAYDVCRADWFGGCFEVVGGPWTTALKGNKFSPSFTTAGLRKGSKYFVRVRLNKTNSKFYSEAKSDQVSTNSVKN